MAQENRAVATEEIVPREAPFPVATAQETDPNGEEAQAEQERKEILRKYRRLLRLAKPYLKDQDAKLIKKAFSTSMEAHQEMRRRSGEPYIYHPLAVAEIVVKEIGLGTTAIVSALLHDVVEDTELELEDIERDFGNKIARIIDGLTKISGVFEYGSSQQAENFRKMLLTSVRRRAGDPDQAGRPPAQHAHPGQYAARQATQNCLGDDLPLRAPGPPPGIVRHQVGARGLAPEVHPAGHLPGDCLGYQQYQRCARTLYPSFH